MKEITAKEAFAKSKARQEELYSEHGWIFERIEKEIQSGSFSTMMLIGHEKGIVSTLRRLGYTVKEMSKANPGITILIEWKDSNE